VRGMFTGNPSRKCYPFAPTVVEGKKELKERALELDMDNLMNIAAPVKATNERVLMELERLAYAVTSIEQDTCLVPTGFYYRTAQGIVKQNMTFTGVPLNAPISMANFQLFREPTLPKTLANRRLQANVNTFDFLDPVEFQSTWRLSNQPEALQLRARSMLWPGLEFTLVKGQDCNFQKLYFGYGEKNTDLGFLV